MENENIRLTAEELAKIDFAVELAEKARTGVTLTADQARGLLDTVAYWIQRCGTAELTARKLQSHADLVESYFEENY